MLSLLGSHQLSNCSTTNRREFLRIGSLGLAGLSLPGLLAAQAQANKVLRDRAVVFLYLQGGPPQIETFDPKPDAPSEIRSCVGQVSTSLPGVQFGGVYPKLAALADRLAVVRSFASGDGGHNQLPVLTGKSASKAPLGSIYSRAVGSLNARTGVPTNTVIVPEAVDPTLKLNEPTGPFTLGYVQKNYVPAGTLGADYDAFMPTGGAQLLKNLQLSLSKDTLDDRRNLLGQLDTLRRQLDKTKEVESLGVYQQQAYDVLLRGVLEAFDLSKEDPKTLAKYDTSSLFRMEDWHLKGKHNPKWRNLSRTTNLLGKQMLLARRLCEAGCGFVTVVDSCWDFHGDGNNPPTPIGMNLLGPQMDHAVAAFLEDVHARGLSDKILLVISGEMGRSPKKGKEGGTGHWAELTPLLLAGGGLKMGQVIGKTDAQGGKASTDKLGPQHLLGTVLHTLFDVNELRITPQALPAHVSKEVLDAKTIPGLL